jgi:adenylyltransferase/sulfurtransferase
MISGIGKPLSGELLVFDFLNDEVYKMKLKADPANKLITELRGDYSLGVGKTVKAEELQEWYDNKHAFVLLDVRETEEYAAGHLPGARNIPLSTMEAELVAANEGLPTVLYCQKGGRSAKAAMLLRRRQPSLEVLELAGGMDGWIYNIERP